jgi:hypothetical protein
MKVALRYFEALIVALAPHAIDETVGRCDAARPPAL